MKKLILSFILLFSVSCGVDSNNFRTTDSGGVKSQGQFISTIISVPDQSATGGVTTINYNNKSYLIGKETDDQIANQLSNLNPGQYSLRLKGEFNRGTGYFPNPTATFDVIHITEIAE